MNRRGFLSKLFGLGATAAAAKLPEEKPAPLSDDEQKMVLMMRAWNPSADGRVLASGWKFISLDDTDHEATGP